MRPEELRDRLRQYYGANGWTVYDRRDRWMEEHNAPLYCEHEDKLEGGVVVTVCAGTGAVLVTGDPCLQSRCRCGVFVIPEDVADFLANDMLCFNCKSTTDVDYAETIRKAERRKRDHC